MTKSPLSAQESFVSHVVELRKRLLLSVVALAVASVIGLIFCQDLFHWIQIPMLKVLPQGSSFITTSPFESYITYFKIAFFSGLFAASPIIFYQIWSFIAPGLNPNEKKMILPFSLLSAVLFVGGAVFGYFVVFPAGFYYVNQILDGTGILLMPKMSDYLSVATTMLLAFGVSFEIPLVIFILGKLGLITYQTVGRIRRYVVVGLFVLAAILTPGPDVISQCLLALPLWFLYELGGLSLLLTRKKESSTP